MTDRAAQISPVAAPMLCGAFLAAHLAAGMFRLTVTPAPCRIMVTMPGAFRQRALLFLPGTCPPDAPDRLRRAFAGRLPSPGFRHSLPFQRRGGNPLRPCR